MTQVIINPGSGPVASGPRQVSQNNIRQFIEDLGVPADWEFVSENKDGRHTYRIMAKGETHEVEMPAIPLENVRYLGDGQNIWDFPRLYIDGSSWVWRYALNCFFNDADDE
ncbi:MAG: hypothetical protein IPI91_19285 [Flavobacteriales bacterium]|nr:hypothetical protein [Flavobacteriales bacterium]